MDYEAVIGLEVHVQARTATKMFCGCPNQSGGEPNTFVCPVCLGYPGVLPVMNREAIRTTIVAGLMCGCDIAPFSKFDRKSYFYPDMQKNYQISQYDLPLCLKGAVPIAGKGFSGTPLAARNVGLTRIHLEEDVAKSTHFGTYSVIDFNRAGVPLLEIVSEPDMHTPDEAYAYLTALKQVLEYAQVGDCDMEKGQMRCDVNVSVRPRGQARLGEKIEIKNLNSFRAAHRALEYEIVRQIEALETGEALHQETRRWNDEAGVTSLMRSKENAHDYRYFPEPDLMPVEVGAEWLDQIRATLPEAPAQRRARFVQNYGLTEYDAQVLTQEKALADYFETAARTGANAKALANWVMTELLRVLSEANLGVAQSTVSPAALAELVGLIEAGAISHRMGKDVFGEMFRSGEMPKAVVARLGLVQESDTGVIDEYVRQAIAQGAAAVAEYRAGKQKALQSLVGQVMKLSRGKANPQLVVKALQEKLG